jgi:hypothetical protein
LLTISGTVPKAGYAGTKNPDVYLSIKVFLIMKSCFVKTIRQSRVYSSRVKGIFRGTNADTEVPGCTESKAEDKITINMMDLRECNQPDSRIWLNTYVSPETHETIAVKKYPATPA